MTASFLGCLHSFPECVLTEHMSSSSSASSSDGETGGALTVRVRPLEYHRPAWAREVLQARDFRAAVLFPLLARNPGVKQRRVKVPSFLGRGKRQQARRSV